MDDPIKKLEPHKEGTSAKKGGMSQKLIVGGTLALVLIAYLTYKKMGSEKSGGQAATGSPEGVNPPTTATDVPSGEAAPQTTVPFAAPTDTTGGGTIQTGNSTNAPAGGSSTKAQGEQPTPKAPQAQSIMPTPHPAGHPALIKPQAPPHPIGKADAGLPGDSDYPNIKSPVHPLTKAAPPRNIPKSTAVPYKAPQK
jgi:hypothetical protein